VWDAWFYATARRATETTLSTFRDRVLPGLNHHDILLSIAHDARCACPVWHFAMPRLVIWNVLCSRDWCQQLCTKPFLASHPFPGLDVKHYSRSKSHFVRPATQVQHYGRRETAAWKHAVIINDHPSGATGPCSRYLLLQYDVYGKIAPEA